LKSQTSHKSPTRGSPDETGVKFTSSKGEAYYRYYIWCMFSQ